MAKAKVRGVDGSPRIKSVGGKTSAPIRADCHLQRAAALPMASEALTMACMLGSEMRFRD